MSQYKKVVFYYSPTAEQEAKYPANIDSVLAKLKQFEAKGVAVEAINMDTVADPFRMYTYASTGPKASRRPILGAVRGADYNDFFGKTIPVLALFENDQERRPFEVIPRFDESLGRMMLVEEAVDMLLEQKYPF
jgi:hypothetical protein